MERLTFIDHLGWYVNGNGGERIRGSHINRLAAYENTGLEPEDMAHWMDYFRAECEGRLVVLPCKVGDDVWFVRKFGKERCIKRAEVSCINIDFRGEVFVSARRISGGYIGKTVFLTREEAEAALAQEGGKDHA